MRATAHVKMRKNGSTDPKRLFQLGCLLSTTLYFGSNANLCQVHNHSIKELLGLRFPLTADREGAATMPEEETENPGGVGSQSKRSLPSADEETEDARHEGQRE